MSWIFWIAVAVIIVPHLSIMLYGGMPGKHHSLMMLLAGAAIVWVCKK